MARTTVAATRPTVWSWRSADGACAASSTDARLSKTVFAAPLSAW